MSVYFNTLKKDNVPEEILKHTKDGRIRKYGRTGAHSIDYDKCIGMTMNFHDDSEPFLILAHFKGDDKQWYLKLTDGTNIYIERKDKAVRNKKWSKNVVIEDMPQQETGEEPVRVTYQLCLPAPMELIDRLVEESNQFDNLISPMMKAFISAWANNVILEKLVYVGVIAQLRNEWRTVRRTLLTYYHEDNRQSYRLYDIDNTMISTAFDYARTLVN